jgi:hypothetical protein
LVWAQTADDANVRSSAAFANFIIILLALFLKDVVQYIPVDGRSALQFRARLGAHESFKETAAIPTRALGAIGNRFDNLLISSVEAGSGFKIDGLLKIV